MFYTIRQYSTTLLLIFLFGQAIFSTSVFATPKGEKKLVVLSMTYENFSVDEREMMREIFYKHLEADKNLTIIPEDQVPDSLRAVSAGEIDSTLIKRAAQIMEVDYVLVGELIKIGSLVDAAIQLYKITPKAQDEISDSKKVDKVNEELIPLLVKQIHQTIDLETEEPDTGEGRKLWPFVLGGAAVGGIVAAIIISNGDGQSAEALPRPPNVH